jgi:hypothetical protein
MTRPPVVSMAVAPLLRWVAHLGEGSLTVSLLESQVIEGHQKTNTELPVNLKMCFEGMEESGSDGLEDVVQAEAKKLFDNVDAVCIS